MKERPANTDLVSYLSEFVSGWPTDQRRKLVVNGTDIPFTPGAEIHIEIEIEDEDGSHRKLVVNLTYDGLTTNAFDTEGKNVGTDSITFKERHEQLSPKPVHELIKDLQIEFDGRDASLLDELESIMKAFLRR